jgi:hypothetical protein
MTSPSFYNNLLISSIFPYKTEKYSIISPPTKRHSFLNGLALLLNGSKSCTSVYPWFKKKQLLIACNEPLTNNDTIYFDHFFGLIRIYSRLCLISDRSGMIETHSLLNLLIFQYNKDKCIKRIFDPLFNDVISNLVKLVNYDIDEICENIIVGTISKGSPDYVYLKAKDTPLNEYISMLFTWVKDIISLRDLIEKDKKKTKLKTLETIQAHCEVLYYSKIFGLTLKYVHSIVHDHDHILYYLDKVSAHKRSVDLLLKCLEKRKADYGEMYKDIQWYFIEPIENTVELKEQPLLSFDKIWLDCGLPNDQTKIDFKLKFIGNQLDKYDKELKIETCIHCEIRIIDYLIEQNIHEVHDPDIEIGISKLPCYLCSLYIENLNEKYNRTFCVASLTTHGKIYPKWAFRNNEEDGIMNSVNDQLYRLIKKELKELERDNRKKSGESDKQETSLDGDDVDDWFMNHTINTNMKHR